MTIRALLTAVACAAALVGVAAPAQAVPSACHASDSACQIVAGMHDGVPEQPCSNWAKFPYGFGPDGQYIACVSFDGGQTGKWQPWSAIAAGVREVGGPCCSSQASYCPTGFGGFAQAADGQPLTCHAAPNSTSGTWEAPPGGFAQH